MSLSFASGEALGMGFRMEFGSELALVDWGEREQLYGLAHQMPALLAVSTLRIAGS